MPVDVSVIIPTFRRPAQLTEALQSALSQEGVTLEVVVLDDSPEGSAREAVERIGDRRVIYRKRQEPSNGRPAVVRNAGWPMATGRYVHFLDDDDRVAPGAYRAFVRALDAHPNRGVAFGRVEPFGSDPALPQHRAFFERAAQRARLAHVLGSRLWLTANLLFKPTLLNNSACIIRRKHIATLHGYNPELPLYEDLDFYLRAIRAFGFVFVDQVVVQYRMGEPSLMSAQKDTRRIEAAYNYVRSTYRAAHGMIEYGALRMLSAAMS